MCLRIYPRSHTFTHPHIHKPAPNHTDSLKRLKTHLEMQILHVLTNRYPPSSQAHLLLVPQRPTYCCTYLRGAAHTIKSWPHVYKKPCSCFYFQRYTHARFTRTITYNFISLSCLFSYTTTQTLVCIHTDIFDDVHTQAHTLTRTLPYILHNCKHNLKDTSVDTFTNSYEQIWTSRQ